MLTERFRRACPDQPVYRQRLARELSLIESRNFTKVFEQVLDILDLSPDIPHLVRGSCGNSLLCYLLGITPFDPVAMDLPVARFMHERRPDFPDFDLDFPYHQRDCVLERVYRHWPGRVARISNHVRYRERSAVREAMRQLGHRHRIPRYFSVPAEQESAVRAISQELLGSTKHEAKHCGGIVIFEDSVPHELLIAPKQIGLDKDEVEARGWAKIDLLCNRALAQLYEIDTRPIESYPERDGDVAECLTKADTLGVTFAESPAMQRLLRGIQPRCRQDVVLALALIRPSAASDGRKNVFLEHWRRTRTQGDHLVYDDDGILLIQRLLGCNDSDAEVYRKGFAKKNMKLMREFAERIKDHPDRDRILTDLCYYNRYSFCKAHALAYGYLVWALAYQKVHRPKPFWLAALNHACSMYRPWVHVQEAKRVGFEVRFGRRPWRRHEDVLLAAVPEYTADGWHQYAWRGYWTSNRFMPGMFLERKGRQVRFRGLIATGRHYQSLSFITIGYADGKFIDLVINGLVEFDRHHVVEGEGYLQENFDSWSIQCSKYQFLAPGVT